MTARKSKDDDNNSSREQRRRKPLTFRHVGVSAFWCALGVLPPVCLFGVVYNMMLSPNNAVTVSEENLLFFFGGWIILSIIFVVFKIIVDMILIGYMMNKSKWPLIFFISTSWALAVTCQVAALIFFYNYDYVLRWAFSRVRGDAEAIARRTAQNQLPAGGSIPTALGPYTLTSAEAYGDAVLLRVGDGTEGFAYAPGGIEHGTNSLRVPRRDGSQQLYFYPIDPPWYVMRTSPNWFGVMAEEPPYLSPVEDRVPVSELRQRLVGRWKVHSIAVLARPAERLSEESVWTFQEDGNCVFVPLVTILMEKEPFVSLTPVGGRFELRGDALDISYATSIRDVRETYRKIEIRGSQLRMDFGPPESMQRLVFEKLPN